MTRLFMAYDEPDESVRPGRVFGERNGNNRYHMPLLPGEKGTKAGGDWVPYGIQSATNLAGAIVESRQLGIWERERSQIGLALRPDLAERLAFLVRKAHADGFDFTQRLHDSPEGKAIVKELDLIHREAKQTAYGNLAAQRGTNRHDVWEARAPQVAEDGSVRQGLLFGTPEINEQTQRLESLLHSKGLERVPRLQERVVRNIAVNAAGQFDDVLRATRDIEMRGDGMTSPGHFDYRREIIPAGTLLMADLKTKQRQYYSWLEVRIQLAIYATAEWMLPELPRFGEDADRGPTSYIPGPKHHVNQDWGVILWAPSDGQEPQLKRANLRKGFEHAKLARLVHDARSEAKNVAAHGEAVWPDA